MFFFTWVGKLSSRHYRDNYYASAFNYVVSITNGTSITNNNNYYYKPEPISLGSQWEWSTANGEKKLTEIVQYGYYTNLFATLKVLTIAFIHAHTCTHTHTHTHTDVCVCMCYILLHLHRDF